MQTSPRSPQKAQSNAVRGELGRYPIGIDVAANMLAYTEHGNENSLLHRTLVTNRKIADLRKGNLKLWINNCNSIQTILEATDNTSALPRISKNEI